MWLNKAVSVFLVSVLSSILSLPGEYLLSVKFNDRHITNSPFAVHVDRPTSQEENRQARLLDNVGCQVCDH